YPTELRGRYASGWFHGTMQGAGGQCGSAVQREVPGVERHGGRCIAIGANPLVKASTYAEGLVRHLQSWVRPCRPGGSRSERTRPPGLRAHSHLANERASPHL